MELLEEIFSIADNRSHSGDDDLELKIGSIRKDDTVEIIFHKGHYSYSTVGYFVRDGSRGIILKRDKRTKSPLFQFLEFFRRQYIGHDLIQDIRVLEQDNPCDMDERDYHSREMYGCDDYDKQYLLDLY